MRTYPIALTAVLTLAACPYDSPIETGPETSAPGETSSSTVTPTEAPTTEASTTEATVGTTVGSTTGGSTTTTTTGETDPTTDSESTGPVPNIVVEGLSHPESILHDRVDDVYLISNINGDPGMADDNGFISRVLPDGTIDALKFIDGGAEEVVLDAPKGMAVLDDVLYVADITQVRKFDRVTGTPMNSIQIPDSVFLNDISASPLGRVFVSDTMTNTIHIIENDETLSILLMDDALDGANGLFWTGDAMIAVGYNGPNVFFVPYEGATAVVGYTFDFGQLDGVVEVPDGLIVSSWEGQGIFHLTDDLTTMTAIAEGIDSPADIEVDVDRGLVLAPILLQDRAEFFPY